MFYCGIQLEDLFQHFAHETNYYPTAESELGSDETCRTAIRCRKVQIAHNYGQLIICDQN